MKLGISGQALSGQLPLRDIISLFKQHGVTNMELWPENLTAIDGLAGYSNAYDNKDINALEALLSETGMNVACVTFSGAFVKEFVDDAALYREALKTTVRVAHRLGAGIVNHYCYHICLRETPDFDRLLSYYSPAVELAEQLGVILTLENEAHDATARPENMKGIVDKFSSPAFRTNFDATNYVHAGVEGFPYAYEMLREDIAYVHIKNGCLYADVLGYDKTNMGAPMGGEQKDRYIYYPALPDGAVNIDGLLLRLKRDGYDGYCVLEPHASAENTEAYYQAEVQYLRDRKHFAL